MMRYKTLKNMERATKLIAAKGYDWKTANDIAINLFEEVKRNFKRNGMGMEFYIDKIAVIQ